MVDEKVHQMRIKFTKALVENPSEDKIRGSSSIVFKKDGSIMVQPGAVAAMYYLPLTRLPIYCDFVNKFGASMPVCIVVPLVMLRRYVSHVAWDTGGSSLIMITSKPEEDVVRYLPDNIKGGSVKEKTKVWVEDLARSLIKCVFFETAESILSPLPPQIIMFTLVNILMSMRAGGAKMLTVDAETFMKLIDGDWIEAFDKDDDSSGFITTEGWSQVIQGKVSSSGQGFTDSVQTKMDEVNLALIGAMAKSGQTHKMVLSVVRFVVAMAIDLVRIVGMGGLPGVQIDPEDLYFACGSHTRSLAARSMIMQLSMLLGPELIIPKLTTTDQIKAMANILCTGNGYIWRADCNEKTYLANIRNPASEMPNTEE